MKVTTAPPKQKFLTEEDRRERASRTKVAVLSFAPASHVQRIDINNSKDLSRVFATMQDSHENTNARLIVVEDLSQHVIEILGSRFDVDPLFFRGHISDYTWHNIRDPWVELPDLDIMSRKRSYLHVQYVQTKYFRDEASIKQAKWEAGGFNVLRRVDRDGNWVRNIDIPNSDVGLVRSRTSLWIKPNPHGEKGILGKSEGPFLPPFRLSFFISVYTNVLQVFFLLIRQYHNHSLFGEDTALWPNAHPWVKIRCQQDHQEQLYLKT